MIVIEKVERPKTFELIHGDNRKPIYRFVVRGEEADVIVEKWRSSNRSWDLTVYRDVPVDEARMLWKHLTKQGYERF